MPDPTLVFDYLCARFGIDIDLSDERGMTTTEVAVVTFQLVGAAIVVLGIIYTAAKGNADNITTPEQPACAMSRRLTGSEGPNQRMVCIILGWIG